MKSWVIILILQMTFVAAGTVEAADRSTEPNPIALMGGLDCAAWINARENKPAVSAENYVQGLVNGFSLGRGMSIWDRKPVTREQFFLWMDKFCRENPLEGVLMGSSKFANEMTNGMWDARGAEIRNLK